MLVTHPLGEVTVGSCATDARESGQDRKVAAFIGSVCVPQTAWPLPHSTGVSRRLVQNNQLRITAC